MLISEVMTYPLIGILNLAIVYKAKIAYFCI